MRNYKGLMIPDRYPRNNTGITDKQDNYCHKSNCTETNMIPICCSGCLFSNKNIVPFEEWYMNKNNTKKQKGGE